MHSDPTIEINAPIVYCIFTWIPKPKYAAISRIKAIIDNNDVLID